MNNPSRALALLEPTSNTAVQSAAVAATSVEDDLDIASLQPQKGQSVLFPLFFIVFRVENNAYY
jgi:hypothetical protein